MDRVPAAPVSSGRSSSLWPVPPAVLLGFVAKVLAVLLIAYFSYQTLQVRTITARQMTATLTALEQLQGVMSTLKDAETGQRGFLLTGAEVYLDPYTQAKSILPGEMKALRQMLNDRPQQRRRMEALEQLTADRMEELGQTVALKRLGDSEGAMAMMRTDRGKTTMDRLRVLVAEMVDDEREVFAQRQREWQDAGVLLLRVTWGGSALLLMLIAASAGVTWSNFRNRAIQGWLRLGQMGLSARLQGEQRLDKLGEQVLQYLAEYLDAQVGAVYMPTGAGTFQRVASYALPQGAQDDVVHAGQGLLGQVVKDNKALHVVDVPPGYLPVGSGLGTGQPSELLIAPASVDGVVHAVIELGFLRKLRPQDQELMSRVVESLGIAVRTSKDRTRLEELLEETQRQAEELQAQQEELRVSNEELEEQGRALKESRGQLEAQHAELEQTNSQLEEQTQLLEHQRDELSKAQAVLTEKAAELERANQYKSEFLANMSHELRTPLNSSLILAKLLADNKDGNLTAEQVKFAQTISAAGNDLLSLINDILDLSKIEAGKVEVASEPVAIARAVDALTRIFVPLAQQKGLAFKVSIDPAVPRQMQTDELRLAQILRNLLSNATKFTDKGEVALDVSLLEGQLVAFAVRDTGIGIPAHQQEIIFEAFRQADGSTHRKYGGTGLGLSISRDLARLMGGDITVHSHPGEGSVFTLVLPLERAGATGPAEPATGVAAGLVRAAAPAVAPPRTLATPMPPVAAGPVMPRPPADSPQVADDRDSLSPDARVILVIEDDPRFASILCDLAHEMDFQCVVTHTAGEGLEAASRYKPSAILLDVNLPDHSGLGVLDQLKRNPDTRHVPVHVLSVGDYEQEARELGAVGYALKPVKREQLVDAFRRLEERFSQSLRRVLVVEDDERQRDSIRQLLQTGTVQITDASSAAEALQRLHESTFDCMVMDLSLPDLSGYELLERMAGEDEVSFPPVIVYTGRSLTRDEEQRLRRYSRSIIIKDARSPERLLDEVTLFIHQVEAKLPPESQRMLKAARDREAMLEGRRILVVEDDVRNIFALSSVLEPKGAKVEIARNGREALQALERGTASGGQPIDLVLMDIMMPEMDGFTAMREIRRRAEWKKLPIIALTAKAMKDDQEKCMAAGANDYIAKPLDVEKLLSLVRVWMPK